MTKTKREQETLAAFGRPMTTDETPKPEPTEAAAQELLGSVAWAILMEMAHQAAKQIALQVIIIEDATDRGGAPDEDSPGRIDQATCDALVLAVKTQLTRDAVAELSRRNAGANIPTETAEAIANILADARRDAEAAEAVTSATAESAGAVKH